MIFLPEEKINNKFTECIYEFIDAIHRLYVSAGDSKDIICGR